MSYVLIVGDGNFSFSLSLTQKWIDKNIIATCFQDRETLEIHYDTAKDNITKLQAKGVRIFYNIDGTSLELYKELKDYLYQCIIFNFPHPGGKNNIKKNKELVQGFLRSSAKIIDPVKGEIWITLCRGQGGTPLEKETCSERGYENSWKIVELAAECQLILTEIKPFSSHDWPGYTPTGYRGNNKSFDTFGAMTHIFTKERINSELWTISQTPPTLTTPTPNTINVKLCKYCCHGNKDIPPDIATIPSDLISYECFKYSLLEQEWGHPLTVVNNDLIKLLTCSLSSLVPISITSLSSLPVIHKATSDSHYRTIQLLSQNDSQQLYVIECSLKDRVLSLIHEEGKEKDNGIILSSAVYPKVNSITSSCNDQPILHQLMILLPNNNIIDNKTVETIISDVLLKYLTINKQTDLYWNISNDERTLMLHTNDDKMISLAQMSSVDTKVNCVKEYPCTSMNSSDISMDSHSISIKLPSEESNNITSYKYSITDVRVMWSKDLRFHRQFNTSPVVKYRHFSLFPPQYIHDVSFWVNNSTPQDTITHSLTHHIRAIAGMTIISVQCIDIYTPLTYNDSISYCYRLVYSSHDRGLGKSVASRFQDIIRTTIESTLRWKLR